MYNELTNHLKKDQYANTGVPAIKFIEWVVELLPPEYDMDVRHRFTPQFVNLSNETKLLWIETHKHNGSNPKFYTTEEVYELWLADCRLKV